MIFLTAWPCATQGLLSANPTSRSILLLRTVGQGVVMGKSLAETLTLAIDAVRSACRLCRSVSADLKDRVVDKADLSPVTIADFGSQALICRTLADAFPDDVVIAEESSDLLKQHPALLQQVMAEVQAEGLDPTNDTLCEWIDHGRSRASSPRSWTLDPIDGTKGFIRQDQYAVALALLVDHELQLGILGCPNLVDPVTQQTGMILWATAGKGAWSQSLEDDTTAPTRLRVTATTDPADARFCESVESGHSNHSASARLGDLLGIHREPLRMDSQCKYAAVAAGWADIYLRLSRGDYQEQIWDHTAGCLIVAEAGGRVTDVHGQPLDFSRGHQLTHNTGIVATNGPLHDRVIEGLATLAEAKL
jgi:3'(2'), 5'-bisphosphate nucleotidase